MQGLPGPRGRACCACCAGQAAAVRMLCMLGWADNDGCGTWSQVWQLPGNLTTARKGEAALLKRVSNRDDALEVLQGVGR